MSLTPGTRLGLYEIVARLGAGGPAYAREAGFGASSEAKEAR
jgi:hypothetical protein